MRTSIKQNKQNKTKDTNGKRKAYQKNAFISILQTYLNFT